MPLIVSRQNPIVRQFREAAASAGDRVLLDGAHLVAEALRSNLEIEIVALASGKREPTVVAIAAEAARAGARVVEVTGSVLAAMSPVRNPSGIVSLARVQPVALEAAFARAPQLVLLLAEVQDPGNVGAIVRAAEACGATGVVAGDGTADPFGWKALRGSMGSTFRLPVVRQPLEDAAATARRRGLRVLAAVPRHGTPLPRCDLRSPTAVLLGGEGAGLPDRLLALSDERLTIPMRAGVESLNVAVAAALIAYEGMRQREPATP